MRKHSIRRKKRYSVYVSIATPALLLALVGILAIDVTRGAAVSEGVAGDNASTFLNSNELGQWASVSVLIDGVQNTNDSWLGSHVQLDALPSPFVTLVAVLYKVAQTALPVSLAEAPIATTRLVMAMVNLPLLAIFLAAMSACIEKVGSSNWSRYCCVAIACFATMLLPLTSSLNSLLPAATATAVTMWLYLYVADRFEELFVLSPKHCAIAGFTAVLAGAFDVLAAVMIVPWLVLFARLDRDVVKQFLAGAGLGLAFTIGSFAIGMLGTKVQTGGFQEGSTLTAVSTVAEDAMVADSNVNEPSTGRVSKALHSVVGHHGLFSLTPLWLLLPVAFTRGMQLEPAEFRRLTVVVIAVSIVGFLVSLGFAFLGEGRSQQVYLSRLVWMIPLWLLMLVPTIEELSDSRLGKLIVIALVSNCVLSAVFAFPAVSKSPWLLDIWPLR